MSMEQNKRHTFDAYCKRLVKNEAVNIHLEYARQGKREAVFSELTQRELQSLCCTDRCSPFWIWTLRLRTPTLSGRWPL